MRKSSLLALLALVSAAGVNAADNEAAKSDTDTSSSSDQQPAPKKEKEKLICHTNRATGSLTRVNRVCHTQAQWDQIAEFARKNVNDISRRENVGADSGSSNGANNASGFGF